MVWIKAVIHRHWVSLRIRFLPTVTPISRSKKRNLDLTWAGEPARSCGGCFRNLKPRRAGRLGASSGLFAPFGRRQAECIAQMGD